MRRLRQPAVTQGRRGGHHREDVPPLVQPRVPRILHSRMVYSGQKADMSVLSRESRSEENVLQSVSVAPLLAADDHNGIIG